MPVTHRESVGISRLAYRLPRRATTLRTLKQSRRLRSDVRFLRELGFERSYEVGGEERLDELQADAAARVLDGSQREKVGSLFLYSGLSHNPPAGSSSLLGRFRYPVAQLADRLGLEHASAIALSQQGCSGLLSTIKLAAGALRQDGASAALCVAGDVLPTRATREVMYNVMSDGAAAVLLERGSARNQVISFHQLSESSYWDSRANERELIAAYFPMAQRAICRAVEQACLQLHDIRWIVPSNVSRRSWTILADLLEISPERIWSNNIARIGHTVSCDHIINLADMEREGALTAGDHLLLFTFGFGASWTSMILRH